MKVTLTALVAQEAAGLQSGLAELVLENPHLACKKKKQAKQVSFMKFHPSDPSRPSRHLAEGPRASMLPPPDFTTMDTFSINIQYTQHNASSYHEAGLHKTS